jgi:hypothetical protein
MKRRSEAEDRIVIPREEALVLATPERRPAASRVTVVDAEFATDRDGVDEWASRIAATWRGSVEAIIATGRMLLNSKSSLAHGQFESMIAEKLPFGARTARALMQIARNPLLTDRQHVAVLPPHWGTLAALARFDTKTLEAAFDQKLIEPDLKRSKVSSVEFVASGKSRPPQAKRIRQQRLRNRFISRFADLLGKDLRHRLACLSAADRENLSKLLVSDAQSHLDRIARLRSRRS